MRVAIIALLLATAGCDVPPDPNEAERGLLRALLNERCMANLPEGPRSTHYNDWDEVVAACSQEAYYQSNGCEDPALCLRVMFPDEIAANPPAEAPHSAETSKTTPP